MEKINQPVEKMRSGVSHDRREFLKAGAAIAAAPLMAGVSSTLLPSGAGAADNKAKKIIGISASPRVNSNSDALCDEFMRGAQKAGHQVETIRLAEKQINYCTGCLSCISDPGSCVQQDDMDDIYEKILAADVMVLATPVYFHVMNGQMKVFIDRICPIYTMIRDKEVYFAVSCAGGGSQVESVVQSLRVFTKSFIGVREKGVLSVSGSWNEGAAQDSPAFKQAYRMGLKA